MCPKDWDRAEGSLGSQHGLRQHPPTHTSAWLAARLNAADISLLSLERVCWVSATRHTVSSVLCNKYFLKLILISGCALRPALHL